MNDWQLWQAYVKARQEVDLLNEEMSRRGLFNKPFCEFSAAEPVECDRQLERLAQAERMMQV